MPADTPAAEHVRRVPFAQLSAFPKLFATYCADYAKLADFFAGDFRKAEDRRAAAERAAAYDRPGRDALADALLDQNARWTADGALDEKTRQNIEALREGESVAVVTGQQVGLFTGPLYTPYKTITALQLARQMAEEAGRRVVPVFWLEGEDHDFDEVASAHLLRRNEVVRVRYPGPKNGGGGGPVGRIELGEGIEGVIGEVDAALPDSDFKPALMENLRAAYRPGTTLLGAFAQLLRHFFPEAGLVFLSPDDRRLKKLAAPLFRKEIEAPEASSARVEEAGGKLAESYHQQVNARPSNLFLLTDDGRRPLDYSGGEAFALRGTERSFSEGELLALLGDEPERFSPNVVLRPLVQDRLVPTAAYVAGPGEVSYFAQYRGVYEHFGVPMPVVYPRASATLIEGKVQRVLDKYDLEMADVGEAPERLFQRLVKANMTVDVDAVFKDAARPVHEAMNALKEKVEAVDATLAQSAEATRAALVGELDALKGRVIKAEKRGQDDVRAQLGKARVNLFPDGALQERTVNATYFLNKYGPDLLARLQEALALDTTAHQVVEL